MFEGVVALRKAKVGAKHPDTLKSMSNLAQTLRSAGRTREALPIFEEVLPSRSGQP